MIGPDRFCVKVYEIATKLCHVSGCDYSEGAAASVMETVRAKNGWGFLAVITPQKGEA